MNHNSLITQQKQIVRICLRNDTLDYSLKDNFKSFNVLPFKLLFNKVAIIWLIKNFNYWVNHINNNKRKYLALNAKGIYFKKSFGKKFVNYLSPTYYISMPLS